MGVPPAGGALIIGVDRLLDMRRTAVNVAGDLVASIIIDRRVLGEHRQEQAEEPNESRDEVKA